MKVTLVEWLMLGGLGAGYLFSVIIGNADVTLVFAALSIIVYVKICGGSRITLTKNLPLLFSILLFLVLAAYRIMFDWTVVRTYIVGGMEIRNQVVCYGGSLIQLFMLGAYVGILSTRKYKYNNANISPKFAEINFNYLLIVAWIPLVANMLLYVMFFKGRPYVDTHVYAHGPLGLILKLIYLTYGAMIIMAIGKYSKDRAYRAAKWIVIGFFVVYGVFLQLRSPLLVAALLFVYFYGQRVTRRMLIILLLTLVLAFVAIGIIRDAEIVQGGLIAGMLFSVLGLGEFADALRFAIDESELSSPLWGMGIAGSFLGITEPVANMYAMMIAPDYFDEGGGFGFFILADLVINFGKIGASVAMFVLGVALVRLYYSRGLMVSYVFVPVLFGNLFGIVRNDLGSTFRGVIYTMLSVVVIRYVWRLLRPIKTRTSANNATSII